MKTRIYATPAVKELNPAQYFLVCFVRMTSMVWYVQANNKK